MLPKDQLAKPPENKRENTIVLNFGFDRVRTGRSSTPNHIFFFGDEKFTVASVGQRLKQESQFYTAIGTDLADVTVRFALTGNQDRHGSGTDPALSGTGHWLSAFCP